MLLIDAANVIGSRPTGWWRDRAGAARNLIARVAAALADESLTGPVVVVLEGRAREGSDPGDFGEVTVVHAPGAADDTLVDLASGAGAPVRAVTADRALRGRLEEAGAEVVGPNWLFGRLAGPTL